MLYEVITLVVREEGRQAVLLVDDADVLGEGHALAELISYNFV